MLTTQGGELHVQDLSDLCMHVCVGHLLSCRLFLPTVTQMVINYTQISEIKRGEKSSGTMKRNRESGIKRRTEDGVY